MNTEVRAKLLKSAMWYLEEMKWSVIPVGKDKKPLIKWEEYQKRLPTKAEVGKWWLQYPEANIGVVTGKVSNLACIDIDDPMLKDKTIDSIEDYLKPPTTLTPRGGRHLYFTYPDTDIRNAVSIIPKVDIRGEGGYVVAPPSINGEGKCYTWVEERKINKTALSEFPYSVVKIASQGVAKPRQNSNIGMFNEGRRDDDLFHIANMLIKGGAREQEVRETLLALARTCSPPFPEEELSIKIESAMKRAEKRERNVTEEIKHWVDAQEGFFDTTTLYRDLDIKDKNAKSACLTALSRLVKEGVIERFGKKAGTYRLTNHKVDVMNWEDAPVRDMTISYPFGLERMVVTYPSNIIVIAGASNSGKTTFLLDFARMNAAYHDIHYFNSEMGASELKMRLGLFQNCNITDWKRVKFYERNDNFDDVIRPDKVNIIDYLEVLNDFWKVGEQIKAIHSKLTTGIAVIAIQKNRGTELGRGGAFGTEKPRLYLSMDYGRIKIIKAKNWKTTDNPNNLCLDFSIGGGWKFIPKGEWHADNV